MAKSLQVECSQLQHWGIVVEAIEPSSTFDPTEKATLSELRKRFPEITANVQRAARLLGTSMLASVIVTEGAAMIEEVPYEDQVLAIRQSVQEMSVPDDALPPKILEVIQKMENDAAKAQKEAAKAQKRKAGDEAKQEAAPAAAPSGSPPRQRRRLNRLGSGL